jgi:oxygen-independent coproporphyrinogen-3 oxidase
MTITAELNRLQAKRLPLIPNYPSFKKWKRSAVAEKLEVKPLCLYLHIPFCTQRCSFCYYKTVDLKERPEVDGYVETLCKEIKMVSDRFDLSDRPIQAVYFGGGTPSLLKPHQL